MARRNEASTPATTFDTYIDHCPPLRDGNGVLEYRWVVVCDFQDPLDFDSEPVTEFLRGHGFDARSLSISATIDETSDYSAESILRDVRRALATLSTPCLPFEESV